MGGVLRPDADAPILWSDLIWAHDLEEDAWSRVEGILPPGAEGPDDSHYNYFLKGRIAKQ